MTFPDGLRAVASLLVVLPHSIGLFFITQSPSLPTRWMIALSLYGTLGVQIFFVLSGFVIAFTLKQQRVTPRFLGVFIIRRSVRLDPPYWCALALALGFLALQARVSPAHAHLPGIGTIAAHLFYLQEILRMPEINAVFWTLCVEVQLYIAFCSFLGVTGALSRRTRLSMEAVGAGTYLVSLLWPAHLLPGVHGFLFEWWYAFMAGVLVWWACEGRLRSRTALALLLPLGVIAIVTQSAIPAAVLVTAGLLLLCARLRGLHLWLAYRPVLLLGRLSYCLYLVHVPVAGVILALLTRMHPTGEGAGYLALLLIYAASILLAAALHYAVEVPALRWSQQLKSLHRTPPPKIAVS